MGVHTPLRLRHSAGEMTGGAGLVLLRRLWDRLELGERIDGQTAWLPGDFRPALLAELWTVLLLWGGGCIDDLFLLRGRGIRRLFGWAGIPHPATFGRFLRRGGERLAQTLDTVLWQVVRARWTVAGVPKSVMLVLDSTVVVRYGLKQAGAEKGYNPKKPGRPSHHPLVAFLAETGDCAGVRWRPGNAHTADGAAPWIATLVKRLRTAGVAEITVRLDKGFFSREMAEALDALDVRYVLKVPDQRWVRSCPGAGSTGVPAVAHDPHHGAAEEMEESEAKAAAGMAVPPARKADHGRPQAVRAASESGATAPGFGRLETKQSTQRRASSLMQTRLSKSWPGSYMYSSSTGHRNHERGGTVPKG